MIYTPTPFDLATPGRGESASSKRAPLLLEHNLAVVGEPVVVYYY